MAFVSFEAAQRKYWADRRKSGEFIAGDLSKYGADPKDAKVIAFGERYAGGRSSPASETDIFTQGGPGDRNQSANYSPSATRWDWRSGSWVGGGGPDFSGPSGMQRERRTGGPSQGRNGNRPAPKPTPKPDPKPATPAAPVDLGLATVASYADPSVISFGATGYDPLSKRPEFRNTLAGRAGHPSTPRSLINGAAPAPRNPSKSAPVNTPTPSLIRRKGKALTSNDPSTKVML